MKEQAISQVRAYFSQIESEIVSRLLKDTTYDNTQPTQCSNPLLRSILHGYFSQGKQNLEANYQQECQMSAAKQKHQDQSEKIIKMKKQMDLQFQMTRKFVKEFSKPSESQPLTTRFTPNSPRIELQKGRDVNTGLPSLLVEQHISNQSQKALNKLRKLQNFMYKKDNALLSTRNYHQGYTFSPTKSERKQQNKRLRIQLDNLKSRLETMENNAQLEVSQQLKLKHEDLAKRQRRVTMLESELHSKQLLLTKKETDLLLRGKASRRHNL